MSRNALFAALLTTASLLFAAPSFAQESKPLPAQTVLETASKKAKAEKKNVFVIFHASWCGWCKKLDAFLEQPEIQKPFASSYVLVHLDVMERGEKKSLENEGGGDVLEKLGGAKSGLPFYAILDTEGKKLADSNVMPKDQNIGYPGTPEEIAAFNDLLKKTAPKMKPAVREKLIVALKKNAPRN